MTLRLFVPVEKIRIIKDIVGGTLTIWFGNPIDESICEEMDNGIVLMKDKDGNVIGFEYLYYGSHTDKLNIDSIITRTAS